MLYIIAQKNIMLQNRLDFIGKKTIRLKILSFLKEHSTTNSELIVIPYNREEMANFLCIDRAALSHELAKMKKEGLLDYHKNTFRLFV